MYPSVRGEREKPLGRLQSEVPSAARPLQSPDRPPEVSTCWPPLVGLGRGAGRGAGRGGAGSGLAPTGLPGQEAAKAPACLPSPQETAVRGRTMDIWGSPALPSAVEAPARHTGPAGAADGDLAGGDGGPAAQAHEHLLAVVQQAAVAELLERARRLGQHAHALPRRRKKAGR